MYIEAADVHPTTIGAGDSDDVYAARDATSGERTAETGTGGFTASVHSGDAANELDHTDLVEDDTKPKELFSYVNAGETIAVVEDQQNHQRGNGGHHRHLPAGRYHGTGSARCA